MRYEEMTIEGRNAVLEAFRSGRTVDKLYVQDGLKDGPILRQKSRGQSFALSPRNGWIKCLTLESIRG